jgi:hypothetical protein
MSLRNQPYGTVFVMFETLENAQEKLPHPGRVGS